MIGVNTLADKIVEWVCATIPEIGDSHLAFASGKRDHTLPDVAVEIQESAVALNDPDFTESEIQQAYIRTYSYNVLLVVKPEPEDLASNDLNNFVDQLTVSALDDPTLGGRVPGVSPTIRSTFTPPFVEFDDHTRGRLATIELKVGELFDPEDM